MLLGSTIAVCTTVVWILLSTHALGAHRTTVSRDEFRTLQTDVRDLRAEQAEGFREMRKLLLQHGGD